MLQLIGDHNPDIICLQEFNARLAGQSDEFALLDEKYESAVFGRTQAPDSLYGAPLVILSKYRILRSGVVLTPRHLGLGRSADRRRYDPGVQQPPAFDGDQGGRQRLPHQPRISLRYGARGQTAEHGGPFPREQRAACRAGGQHRGGGGGVAFAVHRLRRLQRYAHVVRLPHHGQGPERRFQPVRFRAIRIRFADFFNTLRIDYVLSSEGFDALSYEVPTVDYSDHHPVVVRLRKNAMNN